MALNALKNSNNFSDEDIFLAEDDSLVGFCLPDVEINYLLHSLQTRSIIPLTNKENVTPLPLEFFKINDNELLETLLP